MKQYPLTADTVLSALTELWYEHPGIPLTWDVASMLNVPTPVVTRRLWTLAMHGRVRRLSFYAWYPADGGKAVACKVGASL